MPSAVVEEAQPETSPLHSHFEWDDGEAASNYRLWQARQLIRLNVTVMEPEHRSYKVRSYVSLTADRVGAGGYRLVTDVLANTDMRKCLVRDALADLRVFRTKYGKLSELARVFTAVDDLERETA